MLERLAAAVRSTRRRARTRLSRICRHEFWPTPVLYAPLLPWFAWLSLRHRGPGVFTCCNPGISHGGGMIGESKQAILDQLRASSRWVLPSHAVPAGPDPGQRTASARSAALNGLGGFPVVVKPDSGLRGHAVRLARNEADLSHYFQAMRGAAVVQSYHPGPHECGIMWARRPAPSGGGRCGFIFSITRKEFPVLVGDGRRTLEQLIHDHPRFHCQAAVFLSRFADERRRVLGAGERKRLAESGNHCQGTLFRDGSDLITPQLETRIDEIARRFGRAPGEDGPPLLDIGRFDVRYESDEALRRGEGFAIIELNGTGSESTNIYDPGRSLVWALRVLARQWKVMYELGAQRRREGVAPMPLRTLIAVTRAEARARSGSSISD